ncbi:hypothetical protein [Nonomuraea sp. NPDC050783]|uniref:hypothetical protein n=1 Tax=Nonomuraea sp. NPDC050783 TaxID=3154634 RepID=UPI0034661852
MVTTTFGAKVATAVALAAFGVTAGAALPASAATVTATVRAEASDLPSGKSLKADQYVSSRNGLYKLYQQKDGNLVLSTTGGKVVWASETSGTGVFTTMQKDGNLVIRDNAGKPLWSSATASPGALLAVQNDGNIVIYSAKGTPLWDRRTYIERLPSGASLKTDQYIRSRDHSYVLYQQKDGNLVLSKGGKAVWASRTTGAGVFTTMQRDGNLVVRDNAGQALWSTGTSSPGAWLGVQNDGNVVIWSKNNQVVWALN